MRNCCVYEYVKISITCDNNMIITLLCQYFLVFIVFYHICLFHFFISFYVTITTFLYKKIL
jgi:hypothetical protein